MKKQEIKEFLDHKVVQYNHASFIESDPIQIPHNFTQKSDIEISSFLTTTIAWGQRQTIIKNARQWIHLMDNAPGDFVLNYTNKDLKRFSHFKHRTFAPEDCMFFMQSLKNIYSRYGSIENIFTTEYKKNKSVKDAIIFFRKIFFSIPFPERTSKHVSDINKGSSAKRINLFLRWMIRKDKQGVDFGIWNDISMTDLYLPLDVHTGNVGRKLGLLERKSNDWKAVEQVTNMLRHFDPNDPIKYDYALFGLGVFEGFQDNVL